jgi:uncharacterized protein YndB with AHSA1/START domain
MKISDIIEFAAPPQEVFAMFADEEFQNRKCRATGALRHTVSITTQDERTLIVSTRDMPSDRFPSFVKSMVGATLAVTETQDWGPSGTDGVRRGRLTVEIAGAPVSLHATLLLETGGQGSIETIEGDLKARVPLLGTKIEESAAPAVQSAIRVEGETGMAWLATRK